MWASPDLVPDALSRLTPKHIPEAELETDILEDVAHIYHEIIMELSVDFKDRLKQAYHEDAMWSQVLKVVSGGHDDSQDLHRPMRGLRFMVKDDLIYF